MKISATLKQISQGKVRVKVVGVHTHGQWKPPTADKRVRPHPQVMNRRVDVVDKGVTPSAARAVVASEFRSRVRDGTMTTAHVPSAKQLSNFLEHRSVKTRGAVKPDFHSLLCNINRRCKIDPGMKSHEVFPLFVKGGACPDGFVVVISAEEWLRQAPPLTQPGFVYSDSDKNKIYKNFLQKSDQKKGMDFTAIITDVENGRGGLPLVASFNSRENQENVGYAAKALRGAWPCSPGCRHGWVDKFDADGTYTRWRRCYRLYRNFDVTVMIDKTTVGKGAFREAGYKVAVCVFHNLRAMV